VKSQLLRQNTPNFVNEWAELNGVDLNMSPKKALAQKKKLEQEQNP
jgi:hypothetical protein